MSKSLYLSLTSALIVVFIYMFLCSQQSDGSESGLKLVFQGNTSVAVTGNMSLADADDAYYKFVTYLHYTCKDTVRLGSMFDGGWDACLVGPYKLVKPCLVYSFGINWDFSFDDAVSRKFSCTVRAFDPSMVKARDHRRDANIWFYKIGLGPRDERASNGWTLKTLDSVVNMLNDSGRIIDYLKFDIESNEWDSLEAMYKSNILDSVKQLALEVHINSKEQTNTKTFHQRYKTLKKLEEFGFQRWYWHLNHYGAYQFNGKKRSGCYELVYINTKFMVSS